MENTQVVEYVMELKSLLVRHERVTQHINLLDSYVQQAGHKSFQSNLDGAQGHCINLVTRKSVAMGVKKVFLQFSEKKWKRIRELSTLIIQSLEDSQEVDIVDVQNSVSTGNSDYDEFVGMVTGVFCESSRSA